MRFHRSNSGPTVTQQLAFLGHAMHLGAIGQYRRQFIGRTDHKNFADVTRSAQRVYHVSNQGTAVYLKKCLVTSVNQTARILMGAGQHNRLNRAAKARRLTLRKMPRHNRFTHHLTARYIQ